MGVSDVILTFYRSRLLYDVGNYAFVEGDIMSAGDVEHVRHQVQDVCEEGNADRVTRVLNLAHSECMEMLYPFSKSPVFECVLDNDLVYPEVYTIILSLPPGFSHSTVTLLEGLVHEYMVCRVLADWMSITNPGSKANWEEKIERTRDKIRSALVWRRGRLRLKQSPF